MAADLLDGTQGKESPWELSTKEISAVHKVTPLLTGAFPKQQGFLLCPSRGGKPGWAWAHQEEQMWQLVKMVLAVTCSLESSEAGDVFKWTYEIAQAYAECLGKSWSENKQGQCFDR